MSALENNKPCDNMWLAIMFASINAFLLAGMSLFGKLLTHYFEPIEVTFFRNSFSLVVLFLWVVFARKLFLLKTTRPWAHVFRGAIGTAGIVLGMFAISMMPLAETTLLLFTSPLFTVLLSALILREKVGLYRIIAVLIGFSGVAVMANPSAETLHIPVLGLIVGLGWGFFSGSVDTCLRWIGSTERSETTTFYFMLFGTIATALHWPFTEIQEHSFSWPALWIICGLGTCGLLALLAKSQSFRLGEASMVAPFMYTMIVWAALFDYLFWDKIPGWNVIGGAALIISANLFILYRETRPGKKDLSGQQGQGQPHT